MRTAEMIEALVPISDRSAQRFPKLRPDQMNIVRRYAEQDPRTFEPGETFFEVGDPSVSTWFVLDGSALLIGRDGFETETVLTELQPGEFTGELHQIAGSQSLTCARAGASGCTALSLAPARLRALLVGSAEIGETLMRAMILRRVGLMERGIGPVLVGRAGSSDLLRLQAFLSRSAYPHVVLDCATDRGRTLIDDLGVPSAELPLLVSTCGRVLKRPTNEETGAWLGITPRLPLGVVYDVAVVGSGPAGLATAVYAASEGLSVLVLDSDVVGGQAGASARIENYLGFPTGISGRALTGRALSQAQKFGAEVAIPLVATRLECVELESTGTVQLLLSDQGSVRARTVVVASGARYKHPAIDNLKDFEGCSVHYWASPAEAKLCQDQEIALVGAGNSAGQAVVFLASHVKHLTVIVRGAGLEASMSRYLIDRIRALDNVTVLVQSEIVGLCASATGTSLECLTVRDRSTGILAEIPAHHLFVFIGAEPNTGWLDGCVELDNRGYVLTGTLCSWTQSQSAALGLQTSLPRIFAIGDVRSGSTKRVASAVGEGAAVVAQIHAVLSQAVTTA